MRETLKRLLDAQNDFIEAMEEETTKKDDDDEYKKDLLHANEQVLIKNIEMSKIIKVYKEKYG